MTSDPTSVVDALIDARPAAPATTRRGGAVVVRLLRAFAVGYLLLVGLLMWFEDQLVFRPLRYPQGDWSPVGLVKEDVTIESEPGLRLHGWFCPASQPRAAILYCHGNGGNITHRGAIVRRWVRELNVSVLLFDYRGYGRSDGEPSEAGLQRDAEAALEYLKGRPEVDGLPIVIMGESLGGAVAVRLAVSRPPAGLMLECTFTSVPDVAATRYPFIPVHRLMHNRFDSLSRIGRYRGPLLMAHGEQDSIVPIRFGRRLFEAAAGTKSFHAIPDADHNDMAWVGGPEYLAAIDEFLKIVVTGANPADTAGRVAGASWPYPASQGVPAAHD